MENKAMRDLALYVHIPFCKSKCYYCDFCSYKNRDELIESYIQALCKEIKSYKKKLQDFKVTTVYIGGGTPSYIPSVYIQKVVDCIFNNYNVSSNIEFTIEVNPGTVDNSKFDVYKYVGINRISFGLQSTSDDMLKNIGRIHTFNEFYENYIIARQKGFNNISVDLMFGIPNQSNVLWQETLSKVIELKPEHISAYSLKIEENTRFYELYRENKLNLPKEEEERDMYHLCIDKLKNSGYNQYEISNFALNGYESKHNLSYWRRKDYLGVGLNSASCINDKRFSNETDIEKYIKKVNNNESVVIYEENLDEIEIIKEKIILYLRLSEGTVIDEIFSNQNENLKNKFIKNMEYLIKLELIEKKGNIINLTTKGIDLSNQVFIKLTDIFQK